MDFKKLFRKDDKAVSPVIGVILMVAITVILAAAIGSSVFSQSTVKSAPQANFNIKAVNLTGPGYVRIEHLGGSTIHFEDASKVKVTASLNGGTSVEINADGAGTPDTAGTYRGLDTMNAGDVGILKLATDNSGTSAFTGYDATHPLPSGAVVNIKITDVQTSQVICDKDVRF